jgi:hypothetical protein
MFPPGCTIRRALASRTTTPATVTNHLVRCSRSVIIPPHVVSRASLLGRRTYLNARYSIRNRALGCSSPRFPRPCGTGCPTDILSQHKWLCLETLGCHLHVGRCFLQFVAPDAGAHAHKRAFFRRGHLRRRGHCRSWHSRKFVVDLFLLGRANFRWNLIRYGRVKQGCCPGIDSHQSFSCRCNGGAQTAFILFSTFLDLRPVSAAND